MDNRRCFLFVLDSFGIGNAPDAEAYGDEGSNTLKSVYSSRLLNVPNLEKLGLFHIDGVDISSSVAPSGQYGRLIEKSKSKDTVTGHWEMMGIISEKPMPVFPNGFPNNFIREIEDAIGRKVICNKAFSGTEVINKFGQEHLNTGAIILYTSADSVIQVAAHVDIVPVEELYEICRKIRLLAVGDMAVGRVIARPFRGSSPSFERVNESRHDYSIQPPINLLDDLYNDGEQVIAVGKITDIFNERCFTEGIENKGNEINLKNTERLLKNKELFSNGLCFINLVDFDMKYGHRRDVEGYAKALNYFDKWLGEVFLPNMSENDVLIITADHGCDPCFKGSDHTRETVPILVFNQGIRTKNLGTQDGFCNIARIIKGKLNQ